MVSLHNNQNQMSEEYMLRSKLVEVATMLSEFRDRGADNERCIRDLEKIVARIETQFKNLEGLQLQHREDISRALALAQDLRTTVSASSAKCEALNESLSDLWDKFRECQQKSVEDRIRNTETMKKEGTEFRWQSIGLIVALIALILTSVGMVFPYIVKLIRIAIGPEG